MTADADQPDAEGDQQKHDAPAAAYTDSMANLGQRVREARKQQQMPARELARRLGVSASFLSQFENGRSQAAVSTLFSIARELGLSLDDLLGNDVRASRDTMDAEDRARLTEYLSFQTGVRWHRLAGTEPTHHVQFLYTEYDPGADSAPDGSPQTHPGDDYGYVLDGILTVETPAWRRTLGSGDAIHLRGSEPHRLLNESSKTVRTVWLVVGGPAHHDHPQDRPESGARG